MAGRRKNSKERQHQLAAVSALYLKGMLQYEIAEQLGITKAQITYDIKKLQAQWIESSLVNIDAVRQRELAKIDALEREYWDAWQNSKGTHEVKITAKEQEKIKASLRSEELSGNPQFLTGVQWCIEQRCKILGLNAPKKIAETDPFGNPIQKLSDQEKLNRIEAIFEKVKQRIAE